MSRQYLMMVDEEGMNRFKTMFRGDVQFLEVQGMDIGGNNAYKVLVAPVMPPVPGVATGSTEMQPVVVPPPEQTQVDQ